MSEPDSPAGGSAPQARSEDTGPDADALDRALEVLEKAPDFAKSRYQTEVFRVATELLDSDEGAARLRRSAHRLDGAGVFHGGPWEKPDRLVPELVGGGLKGEGMYPTVEALSELRLLSIAAGETTCESLEAEEAAEFLRAVLKLNLDLLFGEADTEESRLRPRVHARARRLLALVRAETPAENLADEVLEEIEQRAAQRSIGVGLIKRLIQHAAHIPGMLESTGHRRMHQFLAAIGVPTPLAEKAGSPAGYRAELRQTAKEELRTEAEAHGTLLVETGLSNEYHAVFIRLARRDPELLGVALGLSDAGRADLEHNADLVADLVSAGIHPATCDAIYGLHGILDRSLLGRTEVAASLVKLCELDLQTEARAALLGPVPRGSGITANGALVAGALAMLGQPLGVGQGANPTCVAARALSMWSLHAPGYLLEHVVSACRDGTVEIPFEGQPVSSHELVGGLAGGGVDWSTLDAISRVLVPHLDRIYDEMMKRASFRGEDPHKWVNPALYGRWVPNGFSSIFDLSGTAVVAYADFVRLFYSTHHPAFADHPELIYPNPVGIFVTDIHSNLLGYHAVSIQRVAEDDQGQLRVYFFNPNNEGRQSWGRGVEPTVRGHGEEPGESSLPFGHFAAHLYAFHYNPYEVGDGYAVSADEIAGIEAHVRETWGREFQWT